MNEFLEYRTLAPTKRKLGRRFLVGVVAASAFFIVVIFYLEFVVRPGDQGGPAAAKSVLYFPVADLIRNNVVLSILRPLFGDFDVCFLLLLDGFLWGLFLNGFLYTMAWLRKKI